MWTAKTLLSELGYRAVADSLVPKKSRQAVNLAACENVIRAAWYPTIVRMARDQGLEITPIEIAAMVDTWDEDDVKSLAHDYS